MTTHKDFKRLVRGRMQKTGEAYTTARSHLLAKRPHPAFAELAGMSDAAIKAKTGCTWERWVHALDYVQAWTWPHARIAKYVNEKFKTGDWWTQTVTVGYERIKGLRDRGQRRDGSYEASKSVTLAVPVTRLYRAFTDRRLRGKWMPEVEWTVRTATRNKSMRITWPDRTSVLVGFSAKGTAKSQVAVQHTKLPDRAAVARMKAYWTERFAALAGALT